MKKIFSFILALLLFSTPAHAAIAFVSRTNGGQAASSATTATAAQSHTGGNALICGVFYQAATSITGFADTAGNTWTHAGSTYADHGDLIDIYYAYNIAGHGSNVVTATFNANATYAAISCQEFSGLGTTNPLDGSGSTGTGNSQNVTTGTVTISGSEDVIVIMGEHDADNWVNGGNYHITQYAVTGDATFYFADGYRIVTANDSVNETNGITGPWIIVAKAFKNAGGGGGGGGTCKTARALLGLGKC